ncbi:hypothetical protein J7J83_03000 [bacterium]|nr:hypothetical protein [bacterium]
MNLSFRIKTLLCLWLLVGGNFAYASSYSPNFNVQDEALDFAHNSDYLKSSSYSMDLSGIFWTDRPSESASFKIVDANSNLTGSVTPPTPPTPSGGGGGSVAGGRPSKDTGENDVAIIGNLPSESKPDLSLHGSAENEPEEKPTVQKPVESRVVYGDSDGCSAKFEIRYMNTNPYKNDTDNDGVEDCDETWIYGTNPIVKNDNFIYSGIAKGKDFVYTQEKPLFVGRGDFGTGESYTKGYIQLGLDLINPKTEMGMFFLNLKDDMNFVGPSEITVGSGEYESTLYHDGKKQKDSDEITIDLDKKYESLFVDVPNGGMLNYNDKKVYVRGTTGKGYGIVALWVSDKNIDVSATVSDNNGNYYLHSPEKLGDGDYSIYLYAIYKENGKLIRTNHQSINVKMEKGLPYIVEKIKKKQTPKWETAYNIAKTQINEKKIEAVHAVAKKSDPMYLLSYAVFFVIMFISYLFVWKRED